MGCSSSFDQGTVPTHNRPIVLDRAQWANRLAFVKVNREHTAGRTKNFDETIPPDDLKKHFRHSSLYHSRHVIACDGYPTDDYSTRFVGCIVIAAVTAAFLWTYGVIFHRETATVWSPVATKETMTSDNALASSVLTASPVQQPDMQSAAVKFANSDVIRLSTQDDPSGAIDPPPKPKVAAAAPPKRKPKLRKQWPAEALDAYAFQRSHAFQRSYEMRGSASAQVGGHHHTSH